jgi:hypothetical protein
LLVCPAVVSSLLRLQLCGANCDCSRRPSVLHRGFKLIITNAMLDVSCSKKATGKQ